MLRRKGEDFAEPKGEIVAFLGKETEFEGRLTFKGTVRIDGKFSGEISTKGGLILGENSLIRAEVEASEVIISGEINGNINAGNRVEIHTPGKVYGNIKSPILVIDEGVIFEGKTQMEPAKEKKLSVLTGDEKKEELLKTGDSAK